MGWQTESVVQLLAGNTIINPSGIFIYSGPPAHGNLIISEAPAAGTDQFSNAFPQGFAAVVGGIQVSLGISATGFLGLLFSQVSSPPNTAPDVAPVQANASGCELTISSGLSLVSSTAATIGLSDSTFAGSAQISLQAAKTLFGVLGTAFWDDTAHQLNLPVSGGPFISGAGFSNISLAGNFTGTFRVKKLPWNAVKVNGNLTWSGTGPTTAVFGSMPDSSFYPVNDVRHPIAHTGIPSSLQSPPRIFIAAAGGGLQLVLPQVTAANTSIGFDFDFPTN